MCGITGILSFSEKGNDYLNKINSATTCLIKRGPDGEGIFHDKNVALGHRRLSIIDTSDLAAQPFSDFSGRYTIVFNGEIFNYKELKEKLSLMGIIFRSKSDTEVLLYLYISEKEKCLELLDGEFAFAVYDKIEESLFLARDRFGIKPLYYFQDNDRFVFGSEIKSLMAFDIPKVIDPTSLQTYLHLNYIPAPHSIFQNVFKLEAGSWLKINHTRKSDKQLYYKIPYSQHLQKFTDYQAAQKKLKGLLEDSVVQRMIADVPLGTFLSGGIDSSIITAIAAKHTKQLNTFSIGYKDEPMFDETSFARLVAKKHNTNHTVFELSNQDLFDDLHYVLDYIDEPFADSSALAVSILSMRTKKHVTVALSGDGADEIFAGYNKHAAELKARSGGLKAELVKAAHPLLKQLPKSRNTRTGNTIRKLEKFAGGMKMQPKERYWNWAKWSGFSASNIFSKEYLKNINEEKYSERVSDVVSDLNSDYNSVLLTDMKLVLENDMLVKVDRMSMSRSLEVRVPFLDHKIVDFAFSLPTEYKIDKHSRKKILKDAFREELPAELLQRGKQGFEVPLLKWFRTDLKSMITNELLQDDFILEQNMFNPETIRELKAQLFSNNPNDAVEKVWALIVFQYWWKKTFNAA
ncbi:MAG: asparagine synthase [Bacteroidota bacterium]|jgi:asparagine synthase (glutamine-hydrolysing)|nr:asparagine synthase [Bacteroidota bacterium]